VCLTTAVRSQELAIVRMTPNTRLKQLCADALDGLAEWS
jgi:hypothetical protein